MVLANDGEGDMGCNIGLGHATWAFEVMEWLPDAMMLAHTMGSHLCSQAPGKAHHACAVVKAHCLADALVDAAMMPLVLVSRAISVECC